MVHILLAQSDIESLQKSVGVLTSHHGGGGLGEGLLKV